MVAAAFSVAAKPLAGKAGVRRGARRATCTVRAAAAASEMVPDMDKRVRVPPCAGQGLHAWARPLAHTSRGLASPDMSAVGQRHFAGMCVGQGRCAACQPGRLILEQQDGRSVKCASGLAVDG